MSKQTPSTHSESDQQVAFFDILRQNAPRPPLEQYRTRGTVKNPSRIATRENLIDPAYLNHPLYVLTRVRHFPNGGFRDWATAKQLKREGVKSGALDIYLDAARRGYHGLRLEFKADDGDLTVEQVEEFRWLRSEGYSPHMVWHHAEAWKILTWYLDINPRKIKGYPSRHAVKLPAHGGHDARCGCNQITMAG